MEAFAQHSQENNLDQSLGQSVIRMFVPCQANVLLSVLNLIAL